MRARLSALTGVLALILTCLLAPAATAADRYDGIAITIMDKLGSIHQGMLISDDTGTLTKSDCQASGDYQANFSSKSSGSTCLIYKSYSTSAPPVGVYITNKTSSSYDFTFKGYSNILNATVKGKSGLDIKLAGTMLGVPKGSNVTADGAETGNTPSADVYAWETGGSIPEASGTVNFNGSSGGGSNGGGGSSSNGDLGIGDLNGNSGGSGGSKNSTTSPAPSDSPTSDQKGATPAPSATSTAQTSSSSSSSSDDDDNTTLYIVAAVVAVIAVIGVIATVLVVKKNGKKNDQANFGPYPGAPGTGFGPNGPGFGGPAGPSGPAGPGYGPNNFGGPAGPGAPAGGMGTGGPNYGGPNGPVGRPNGPVSGPNYGAPNGPAGGPNYGGPNAPAGSSAPVAPSAPATPSYPQGGYQGGPGAAQGGPAQNGAAQGGYQSPSPSAPSAGYAAAPSAQSAAAGSPFAGQPATPAQPASPAQPLPSSSAGDDVVLPPQVTPAQPQDYDAAPAAGGDAEDYYPTIRLGQDEGLAPTRQYPSFNQNN